MSHRGKVAKLLILRILAKLLPFLMILKYCETRGRGYHVPVKKQLKEEMSSPDYGAKLKKPEEGINRVDLVDGPVYPPATIFSNRKRTRVDLAKGKDVSDPKQKKLSVLEAQCVSTKLETSNSLVVKLQAELKKLKAKDQVDLKNALDDAKTFRGKNEKLKEELRTADEILSRDAIENAKKDAEIAKLRRQVDEYQTSMESQVRKAHRSWCEHFQAKLTRAKEKIKILGSSAVDDVVDYHQAKSDLELIDDLRTGKVTSLDDEEAKVLGRQMEKVTADKEYDKLIAELMEDLTMPPLSLDCLSEPQDAEIFDNIFWAVRVIDPADLNVHADVARAWSSERVVVKPELVDGVARPESAKKPGNVPAADDAKLMFNSCDS